MPPSHGCPHKGIPSSEVTGSICRVPSTSFAHSPAYALRVHLCRFRVRSFMPELFPGSSSLQDESINTLQLTTFVTSGWSRNINLVPIDYGFRPRLRSRLTLRGSSLRRNPWTFGGHGSHMPFCYSCQHSHFRYLQETSRSPFTDLRNAQLPHLFIISVHIFGALF